MQGSLAYCSQREQLLLFISWHPARHPDQQWDGGEFAGLLRELLLLFISWSDKARQPSASELQRFQASVRHSFQLQSERTALHRAPYLARHTSSLYHKARLATALPCTAGALSSSPADSWCANFSRSSLCFAIF